MAQISILDFFTIGIGPSSSHTVGPMRAACTFVKKLQEEGLADQVARLSVSCYGSLAATGGGHGTDKAIILGLMGNEPESVDVDKADSTVEHIRKSEELLLPWGKTIAFLPDRDVDMSQIQPLPCHPNGMHCAALDKDDRILAEEVYYSTGGGFIATQKELESARIEENTPEEGRILTGETEIRLPHLYKTASELIALCDELKCSISDITLANEIALRPEAEFRQRLHTVWEAMEKCIRRGLGRRGILPGGLKVERRARAMHRSLIQRGEVLLRDPLTILDWVNLYALAVNEENAAGGRIVTCPTNGAAGIVPAVLTYATKFCHSPYPDGLDRFLITAGTIALLYKTNASISGADVGCQGEVGVACSMAAAALVEYLGGNPHQVENAAEIGMEHNLGLTCDPIGGLVQIPCIERNAMGAIKAINAARMAMNGNGKHFVPLDKVMQTMLETGRDMQSKYKETSLGGLAVNVVEC